MIGKTILITGGNRGLGLACAQAVARTETGWQIALAMRDPATAVETVGALALPLDLGSLASIRAFPALLAAAKLPPLGAIVCNAGLQEVSRPTRSSDGLETTFAVNHLGHFLLTQLLLPQMTSGGRIVLVSSSVHDPKQKTGMPAPRFTHARDLASDDEPGAEAGRRRYTTSKLCNVLYTYELARRLAAAPTPALRAIRVDAFDPGLMPGTGLARDYSAVQRFAWRFVLPALRLFVPNVHSVARSGQRLAELALSDTAETGRYMSDGHFIRSSEESYALDKARDLWDESLALTHLTASESPLFVDAGVVEMAGRHQSGGIAELASQQ